MDQLQPQPQPSLQVFLWLGAGQQQADGRIHYQSFRLNATDYSVGDCVFLFPEDESFPPYVARILSAFVDTKVQEGSDPHCIEVKWFERRVNLEPTTKGIEESEREVFELEDTDVNPIGCISGKCRIIKAENYEEARSRCPAPAAGSHGGGGGGGEAAAAAAGGLGGQPDPPGSGPAPGPGPGSADPWFFCRGYFQQSTNSFVAYTPEEMARPDVALVDGGLVDAAGHGHGLQRYLTGQELAARLGLGGGMAGLSEQPPTPTRLRGPTTIGGAYGPGGGPIWGLPQGHVLPLGHGQGGHGGGKAEALHSSHTHPHPHTHPSSAADHHLGDPGDAGGGVGWGGGVGAAGLDFEAAGDVGCGEEELSDPDTRYGGGGGGAAAAAAAGGGRNHHSGQQRARAAGQQHNHTATAQQQQQQSSKKLPKATGRTCLECGATTTPQWREGPMGPKTLCNACGVRYVRSQQKAAGQKRGGHKNGQKPDAARGQGARSKRKPTQGGGSSGED